MTLIKTIVGQLLTWSTRVHSSFMQAHLKSMYYYNGNTRKVLSSEQCDSLSRILREGLEIFEFFHDNGYHIEPDLKKGCFRNFMVIYSEIHDPINFRDILLPNRELFFSHLLKYTMSCAENCLMMMLTESYFTNSSSAIYKNLVANLTVILFDKFKHDELSELSPYYGREEDYFSLMQKLIRLPIRTITKYKDDTFIRNIFKQIVVLLIKKSHFSKYCLDHLFLLRTLFKNILLHTPPHECILFNDFFLICTKSNLQNSPTICNLDIVNNLNILFNIGIPDLM